MFHQTMEGRMDENKKVIDILELGKREKIITVFDPENPEMCSNIRLIRMNKSQAEKCFNFSRKTYQEAKEKLLAEETKTGLFASIVKQMNKETIIDTLVVTDQLSLEQNSDLIEIPDEKEIIKDLQKEGKSDEEVDEVIEEKAKAIITEKINKKKTKLSKEPEESLLEKIKQQLMEMESNRTANEVFAERALCYMCYYEDKEKPIFSDDPNSELYITTALRSAAIYQQLLAAYRDFLTTINMTPKEIRGQARRGGDFFTSRK